MATDDPVDRTYDEELARFAADLTTLRIDQGKPSLKDIARHAQDTQTLSQSGVSEALAGRRLPSIDFVLALVKTLLLLGDPDHRAPAANDPRLTAWRERWGRLQRLQARERRNRIAVPDTRADAPAGEPLRCFVAMPGESMGADAAWDDIPAIRAHLLDPVAAAIARQTGREVRLVIEKEKTAPGVVHRSMFREALDAEIYIADLTGANPNVYLELGVRWAARDNVTVVICQDLADVRFNPLVVRVIDYHQDELADSVRRIAQAAVDGLTDPGYVDSPVRDAAPVVTVSRAQLEDLRQESARSGAELARLRGDLADDLLAAARQTTDPARRLRYLEEAVKRNPASWQAHFELGSIFRREGRNADAVEALRVALELRPDRAGIWRELGTALGKMPARMDEAADAFDRALALDATDAETWSTYGGLLRRQARTARPGTLDRTLLSRSLDCYQRANHLRPKQLYPLMNAARIELLLAGLTGTGVAAAQARFADLEHLARYTVSDSPGDDAWAAFDLADTLILTGRADEGLAELTRAAALCRAEERTATLKTVAEPLSDLLTVTAALDQPVAAAISAAFELCKTLAFQP